MTQRSPNRASTKANTSNQNASTQRSALHQLHRVGQLASDFFVTEMDGIDITARQLAVLDTIRAEDGLSQTDLVNKTGIDRSTVADIVRRMEEKGLIKRKKTKADARVYAVSLTEKSKKILTNAIPAAVRADEKLLSVLSGAERTRLVQYLGKITASTDGDKPA